MVLKILIIIWLTMVFTIGACTPKVVVNVDTNPQVQRDSVAFVSLISSSNHQCMDTVFCLSEDHKLRIVYQGEGADSDMSPSLVETWQNDCVEFYIDTDGTARQFRFVWGSSSISGTNAIVDGVLFAQGDPSDLEYNFEICFPWNVLGMECPGDKGNIMMDCSVIDNDSESRKTQIAWSSEDSGIWAGNGGYGLMPLKGHRSPIPPIIDGRRDSMWTEYEVYRIQNEILGKVRDSLDLSASFRFLYDDTALYVYIDVFDDIKKKASIIFDTSEIYDKTGKLVWKSELEKSFHAGGAQKNRRQEDTLLFPAGQYLLHFATDESHSSGHWDDIPPDEPFTGVMLYCL